MSLFLFYKSQHCVSLPSHQCGLHIDHIIDFARYVYALRSEVFPFLPCAGQWHFNQCGAI